MACSLTPFPNLAGRWLAEKTSIGPAGAIVVLGADLRSDGTLGDASLRRALVGLQQYQSGSAPLIVFLGSSRRKAVSEATMRERLAKQLGVPEIAIIGDANALTTREEARRARVLLEPRHVQTILLVTDSLHLRRARYVFEREGFQVGAVAADSISLDADAPEDRLKLARSVAQQAVALLLYRLTG